MKNKKAKTAYDNMCELNLKQIQEEELFLLKKTTEFLDKNNIEYYIWAGSFLGSVRHGGFIPWDDDIDIALKRDEYNKLVALLNDKNYIYDNISGIGFELGNSDYPFVKIIYKDVIVEENDKVNLNNYLWLDVFPLDGSPDSKFYYRKLTFYKLLYLLKRKDVRKLKSNNSPLVVRFFIKLSQIVLRIFKYSTIIDKYIKICSKYSIVDDGYVANNLWGVGYKERFSSSLLKCTKKYKFENIEVSGLKNSDEWLSIRYGDYMKLPPEDKRETHSFRAWKVVKDEK